MRKQPAPKSNKILIALPFWEGDRAAHIKVARLITDLEPEHSQFADILFVSRFDTKIDDATVRLASRRFNVFTHVSRRREIGWPHGCNGLFFGTMEYFAHNLWSEKIPQYKAILVCEADTVPLRRGWIQAASESWDAAQKSKRVCIAGAMVGGGKFGRQHINGGAVMLSADRKFLNWVVTKAAANGLNAGWDWAYADEFKCWGWAGIPGMRSYWQRPTIGAPEVEQLVRDGVWMLHGVKDDSLLKIVRKRWEASWLAGWYRII